MKEVTTITKVGETITGTEIESSPEPYCENIANLSAALSSLIGLDVDPALLDEEDSERLAMLKNRLYLALDYYTAELPSPKPTKRKKTE